VYDETIDPSGYANDGVCLGLHRLNEITSHFDIIMVTVSAPLFHGWLSRPKGFPPISPEDIYQGPKKVTQTISKTPQTVVTSSKFQNIISHIQYVSYVSKLCAFVEMVRQWLDPDVRNKVFPVRLHELI
jgi:hypothetical protein